MISLTQLKQGINRLRVKGGANPESLYDLKNGYITLSGTTKGRGGTVRSLTLPADTKGLTVFGGKLVTFHHNSTAGGSALVDIKVLVHPSNTTAKLRKIHFAQPFNGYLYVVAEYDDDTVFHFYLNDHSAWQANKIYQAGDIVRPTVPNGRLYVARAMPNTRPRWAAGVVRALNNEIIPTTDNGYYYKCVAVEGNKQSGNTEPTWPTTPLATVVENSSTAALAGGGITGDTGTGGGSGGSGGTGGTGTGGSGGGINGGGGGDSELQ
jgi:uncharacterized membrane protein YgcG